MFLFVALTVFGLLHAFVHARVASGLQLSRARRRRLALAFAVAAISIVSGEVAGRTPWGGPLLALGSLWLGVVAIAAAAFIVESVASWLFPTRRRACTVVALAFTVGLSGYSLFNGTRPPRLVDVTVPLAKLPSSASGFTIVQLSDLRLNRHASARRWCDIVDRVNHLSPDLVVVTGDLVDDAIPEDTGLPACFRRLAPRYGVLAVPGNHDYYAGIDRWRHFARLSNVTVLLNERSSIAGVLEVAGIDEPAGRSFAEGGPDLARALAGRDLALPTVVLAHRPESFERAAATGVDLQLSGHTHAGQVPPLDLIVWLFYPYAYGYAEHGASAIYTSCGTGTWGPPMRLFSRNEIVRITLTSRSETRHAPAP